jgi:hypothetical protein
MPQIRIEKVIVLEQKKDDYSRENAGCEKQHFSHPTDATLYKNTSEIVNHYKQGEYKYVNRYETHIENAARGEKQKPTESMRNSKIQRGDYGEKQQEFE